MTTECMLMFIAHFSALASYVTVVNYERKVFTRLASDITFSTSFLLDVENNGLGL